MGEHGVVTRQVDSSPGGWALGTIQCCCGWTASVDDFRDEVLAAVGVQLIWERHVTRAEGRIVTAA